MTRKTIVIAVREYQAAIRTKTFIVSLILMPVFMGGSIGVQVLLRDKVDTTDKRIALVDCTGRLAGAILADAERRNNTDIFQGEGAERKQTQPRFVFESVAPPADLSPEALQALTLELSDRVRKRELFAFAIIPADAISRAASAATPVTTPSAGVAYHSNSPTYDDARRWLTGVLTKHTHEARLSDANVDTKLVMNALSPLRVDNLGLVSREVTGEIKAAEKTNELATFFIPFGLLMLMFMVVMISAQPLLQSVLEEKMQRIAEVLVACASPFELMMGKLLGTAGVSLTIVCVYLLGGLFAMERLGVAGLFPKHLIGWFILYQCLAVLMFGSMFSAVGAAVNDLKEAQNLVTPLMLVVVVPLFIWFNVVKEPNASFSVIASFFPFATPMLMIVRMAVPPGVPTWQPVVGALGVMMTTVACVFAAGRVFRIGILMQGKAPKLRELIGWMLHG
ncbi:MAG: ABC transporter permease [Planctomycetota bacterium]|nr:MAG: ABC transporter permease [Planctomycetota bacterium]